MWQRAPKSYTFWQGFRDFWTRSLPPGSVQLPVPYEHGITLAYFVAVLLVCAVVFVAMYLAWDPFAS